MKTVAAMISNTEYPNATGYSVRNLKYMEKFAKTYPDYEIMQRTVAQLRNLATP